MDDSPQLTKAAGDEGQLAKLVCRAQGAPNITFEWSREGQALKSGDKYAMNTIQVDIVTWESTLQVSSVRSRDYGQYDCTARNEMGTNRTSVVLSGTSRPDHPLLLHAVNVSHDAVDLAWRPGFDGGLSQAYRIRYRQVRWRPCLIYSSKYLCSRFSRMKTGRHGIFQVRRRLSGQRNVLYSRRIGTWHRVPLWHHGVQQLGRE